VNHSHQRNNSLLAEPATLQPYVTGLSADSAI